ncbi:MAG: adenylate kinase family protein [Candidatus Nanoarchaeia archaeon]
MFVRAKKVKGHKYAYLVKNEWTKKGPRQKVCKYLGRVVELSRKNKLEFEEFSSIELCAYELVKNIVAFELFLHGFEKKSKNKWVLDEIEVDLGKGKVRENKRAVVLCINNDYLCDFTLKRLLNFKTSSEKEEAARELATAFIQAGIPVREDLYINVFEKSYSPGQTYLRKPLPKPRILVSGTPATGKTTLSKALAGEMKLKLIDVNNLISQENLSEGYDEQRQCQIIDEDKLVKVLISRISEGGVIDSHMSHYVPPKYADFCIITHCDLKTLKKRLKERGYSQDKVEENMEAEIFDICGQEAYEMGHRIVEVNTDKEIDIKKLCKQLV